MNDIPELEGKIAATDAADQLHLTRQSINKMIHAGVFESARRLGKQFVLDKAEVSALAEKRGQRAPEEPEVLEG
jgi:hypothetical protein